MQDFENQEERPQQFSCHIVRVRLEREWPHVYSAAKLAPDRAAGLALSLMRRADRETVAVVHLGADLIPHSAEMVAMGRMATSLVQPRDVFKGALLANALSIYVAHNRLGVDTTPSAHDIALTRRLIAAGELLGVPVIDHLIVSASQCTTSMRQTTDCWTS